LSSTFFREAAASVFVSEAILAKEAAHHRSIGACAATSLRVFLRMVAEARRSELGTDEAARASDAPREATLTGRNSQILWIRFWGISASVPTRDAILAANRVPFLGENRFGFELSNHSARVRVQQGPSSGLAKLVETSRRQHSTTLLAQQQRNSTEPTRRKGTRVHAIRRTSQSECLRGQLFIEFHPAPGGTKTTGFSLSDSYHSRITENSSAFRLTRKIALARSK